jgi:ribonuclease Z
MLDLCLLGCGGTMPLPNRFLTSLLVSFKGRKVLIDCGEGTQVTMKLANTGFKNIDAICFTHYHADHITGLPGVLLAIGNAGRTDPLAIYGPKGLSKVIKGLTVIVPFLPYKLELHELPLDQEASFQVGELYLSTLPVEHSLDCIAYLIEVKRRPEFLPEKAKELNIPTQYWKFLQRGEEVLVGEERFLPEQVLGPPRKGLKVGYVTDARPSEKLVHFLQNCDLLICEGMYGEDEKLPGAITYGHMLFSEAAQLAKEAGVAELWLTHFSPSLLDPENYLDVATNVFPNTKIGCDRMTTTLTFAK